MFNWKTAEREAQGVGGTENMQSAGGGLGWKAALLKGRRPGSKRAGGLLEAWETQPSVMRRAAPTTGPRSHRPKMDTTQVPVNGWTDQQKGGLSIQWNIIQPRICYNMGEPWRHYTKWKKPDTEARYDSICMKYPEWANLWRQKADEWLPGEGRKWRVTA